jgi:hypothetical protein
MSRRANTSVIIIASLVGTLGGLLLALSLVWTRVPTPGEMDNEAFFAWMDGTTAPTVPTTPEVARSDTQSDLAAR